MIFFCVFGLFAEGVAAYALEHICGNTCHAINITSFSIILNVDARESYSLIDHRPKNVALPVAVFAWGLFAAVQHTTEKNLVLFRRETDFKLLVPSSNAFLFLII